MNVRVLIDYVNDKGERSVRLIVPLSLSFGGNSWHPEPQWLLLALDVEKGKTREFAMKDIRSWTPAPDPAEAEK